MNFKKLWYDIYFKLTDLKFWYDCLSEEDKKRLLNLILFVSVFVYLMISMNVQYNLLPYLEQK